MKTGELIKIYSRKYDGKEIGEGTPNKFLGEFIIKKVIEEDAYSGKWIGVKNKKKYMIIETEVSGMRNPENGGSRFEIIEI